MSAKGLAFFAARRISSSLLESLFVRMHVEIAA